MRITNRIMQNNNLKNINYTKVAEDNLSTQISTGKKIVRASDDPIVAIRSLRLRSSVTEITQYYSRNCADANAWLNTTEDAMQQVTEVLTNMIKQYTKGSNEDLTSADRDIILEQLKQLKEEVYSTGDADYAGRYVFTGYRTETSLMFSEKTEKTYQITEQLTADDLKKGTHVQTWTETEVLDENGDPTGEKIYKDLADLQEGTQSNYTDSKENDISVHDYYRIRLSYDVVDAGYMPTISYPAQVQATDENGDPAVDGNGDPIMEWTYKTFPESPDKLSAMKSTDIPSPYDLIAADGAEDQMIYLYDTGELLLGKNIQDTLSKLKDNKSTDEVDEGRFLVTYRKSSFSSGELRPEHYFFCVTASEEEGDTITTGVPTHPDSELLDGVGNNIVYNQKYLLPGTTCTQVIEYDVGYNQRLQVNTNASECFDPGIGREIDDMIQNIETAQRIESVVTTLKEMLDVKNSSTKAAEITKQLNKLKNELQDLPRTKINLTADIDDLNAQKTDLQTQKAGETDPTVIADLDAKIAALDEKIDGKQADLDKINDGSRETELKEQIDHLEYVLDPVEYQTEKYNEQIAQWKTQIEALNPADPNYQTDLDALNAKIDENKEKILNLTDDVTILQNQLDAAEKALTYAKENMQKSFENGISTMQNYLETVNRSVTDCGARGSRLELITTRLSSQKTTFENLKSENEDADLAEVAVKLASANLTYEAALKAAAKLAQTNLMDFI